eukprot:jgi/Hompol1/80/HPOL_004124-RA
MYSLPSMWNPKDKSNMLGLSNGSLRIADTRRDGLCAGPGKTDADAAAVRANNPIPPQTGIYYYEVTVISKGRDGYIGVGFAANRVPLSRLPGWEDLSWGYHGDDGNSFSGSGSGKPYGPVYGTGDVIGCCINFMNRTASFTKNGIMLGVAFRDILGRSKNTPKLFPLVGLRTPGEIVEANFGQRKFKFDIVQYYREERAKLKAAIDAKPIPFPAHAVCTIGKRHIISGDIDLACIELERLYPQLMLPNQLVCFQLDCLKFIAMVQNQHDADQSRLVATIQSSGHTHENSADNDEDLFYDAMDEDDALDGTSNTFSDDNHHNNNNNHHHHHHPHHHHHTHDRHHVHFNDPELPHDAHEFHEPSQSPATGNVSSSNTSEINSNSFSSASAIFSGSPGGLAGALPSEHSPHHSGSSISILDIVDFGKHLQQRYAHPSYRQSSLITQALREIFALVCYDQPAQAPAVAYLMDVSVRHAIASQVNDAIL